MHTIIIEPQFLPPIEYFTRLHLAETVHLDIHHHYVKQSYRNRCFIRGANKVQRLTVPVIYGNRTPFYEVKINYDHDWAKVFWRSIRSAYANSPYYLFYADEFEKIFFSRFKYLKELNIELLTLCLNLLNLDVKVLFSEKYEISPKPPAHDLRSVITSKQHFSDRPFYNPVSYPQLFGANFDANLSVIDLIFCEGPNSMAIIERSTKSE